MSHSLKMFGGIALMLLASGCSREAPSANSTATPKLPIGHVERPTAGEVLRGKVPVGGWAISDDGIRTVGIYLDRNFMGAAKTGLERGDIPAAFPGVPGTQQSGWEFEFDTSKISEGQHELLVQAHTMGGASRDIGTIVIVVAR